MQQDQKNRQSYSFHRKIHSTSLEDYDLDHRVYRGLLSLFADNLNSFIKSYQDCLLDLEDHQRIRVSQEESRYVETGLSEIFRKHICRLSKESLYRNSAIRKGYLQFTKQYQPYAEQLQGLQRESKGFVSFKTPRKKQNSFISRPVFKTDTDHLRLDFQRRRLSFYCGSKAAKSQQPKTKYGQTNTYACRLSQFKAFDSDKIAVGEALSGRVKTSYDRHALQSRLRRGSFSDKNIDEKGNNNENGQCLVIMGEQVVISENRQQVEDWEVDQKDQTSYIARPAKAFCTPRVLAIRNRGQNPQHSFPKMELLRRTKNLWMNSVQPQGYRARSREFTNMLAIK